MTDLARWFEQRPVWLQEAARSLSSGNAVDEGALREFLRLAKLEASGSEELPKVDLTGLNLGGTQTTDVAMLSLGPITGINLLAPREPLGFGDVGITVIYGENGSGKSGCVRILKHVCGARNLHDLLPSAFEDEPPPAECNLSYRLGDKVNELRWKPGMGSVPDLQAIDVFDRLEGNLLASEEADVSYEPPLLQFLSALTEVSVRLARRLQDDLDTLPRATLVIPDDLKGSPGGAWFEAIDAATKDTDLEDWCTWTDEHEASWKGLKARLAEKSPGERARALTRTVTNLNRVLEKLENQRNQLSDAVVGEILQLRAAAEEKERLSVEGAEVLASTVPLPGVGSDVWKEMWEHARRYSEDKAYQGLEFPKVEDAARCVLCHQELGAEARQRMTSFEDFVAGSLEAAAREARSKMDLEIQNVEEMWNDSELDLALDAAGIDTEAERTAVSEVVVALRKRRTTVLEGGAKDLEAVPPLPDARDVVTRLRAKRDERQDLAKQLLEDEKSGGQETLAEEERALRARKWMAQHGTQLGDMLATMREQKLLEDAKALCDTTLLSRKKGELAQKLITQAFADRFKAELESLGGERLPVSLVRTRTERGRVLHRLQLEGAQAPPLAEVLSEGEYRVVSLAAVLADAGGNQHSAPFVFDDPISSLDVEFEERVVRRLVQMARERQLIVFTHRLSLLGLVEELAAEQDVPLKSLWIRREHWGAGEPGGVPIYARNPKSGLNHIVNSELGQARKALEEMGRADYDRLALGMVTHVRILTERVIEDFLLSGVVKRHRRSIQTLNKLARLALITDDDCSLIDGIMTKYSSYVHSQSAEAPVALPAPDEIERDVRRLIAWIDDFRKR